MREFFILLFFFHVTTALWAQAPLANFTVGQTAGCAPLVVSFQDQSTGSPTTWKWDFGNGNTSSLKNPSTTYFSPGSYTISLKATNDNGTNTLTRQALITVYDKPAGNFSVDKTTGCFPLAVQFADSSSASSGTSNVTWQWDFGDGTQSSLPSPRVTFTQAGTFSVNLKVTNDKGCFTNISKSSLIKVSEGVKVAFSNSAVDRCEAPFPVQFSNASTGPGTLTYRWDFGDGATAATPSPSHSYTAFGYYDVSLAVTSSNGCSDTLMKPDLIAVPQIQTAFSAPDSICISALASFTNTSSPVPQQFLWQFGDGSTASTDSVQKRYTTSGAFTVQLINQYGFCTDTLSKQITVSPRPKAQFGATNNLQCQPPVAVRFRDASGNAVSWQWDFGDGATSTAQNPDHTYTAYGDFTVTLIVTNREGCTDTLAQPALVKIRKPEITFPGLPANGCLPYTTRFTSNITTLDNVTSYAWSFGDGSTSTVATPTHTYTNQGRYTVGLTIITSTGCRDSLVLPNAVSVGRKPTVDFTATPNPVCTFQPISFSGTASEADSWQWDFGDGTTSIEQNPTTIFKDTGNFTISLTVSNSGCFETITKQNFITVKPPIAGYRFGKDCTKPRRINFIDQSVGATTWQWDFGDGTTSTAQNPVHDFSAAGLYPVSLTVTNGNCSHTTTSTVQIFPNAVSFTANIREACKTALVNFSAQVPDAATIQLYDWQFGNGATSTSGNPQVSFSNSGSFSATLVTTDIYGCRDTAFQPNYIRINGPTAAFTPVNPTGCKGLNVRFIDQSTTDGQHAITNWQWNYGDGSRATMSNATNILHTYSDTGMYTVNLTVTDAAGCMDSLRVDNLIKTSAPVAAFAATDTLTCLGSLVQFSNVSTAQNFTSTWSFGDGTSSAATNPAHLYNDTGVYSVRLFVTDGYGCSDTASVLNYIQIKETKASFLVSDSIGSCTPFQINFTNTSTFYKTSAWRFGNSASTATNPAYTFFTAGSYPTSLIVTGRGGCTDTAFINITIYDDSATTFSYSPLQGCQPLLLQVSIKSPVSKNYSWDFGDGTIVTTGKKDTVHRYATFGNFVPRLILSDSGNCLLPYFGKDTVRVTGLVTNFNLDKPLLCDSGTVSFIDSTASNENIIRYSWNFGDGGTSSIQNPTHLYQRPGKYTVTLTAQSSSLCQDTTQWVAAVNVVQSPSIGITGDMAICQNESALHRGLFLQPDTSLVQWDWRFPNGQTATTMRPAIQRYSDTGDFFVQAVATNSSGCTDTAFHSLKVNPLPSLSLPPALTTAVGMPVTIQPTLYPSNVVSYLWTPPSGLSCTTCPQPVASPKVTTTYQVLVTDSNGCRNTAEVIVTVFCGGVNVFVPNTFSPNGDGSNDIFMIRGTGLARVKSLRIFNRLGEVIFERYNFAANDLSAGWDGNVRGKRASPDTYIYQVDVFCENNETVRFDGSLSLIL